MAKQIAFASFADDLLQRSGLCTTNFITRYEPFIFLSSLLFLKPAAANTSVSLANVPLIDKPAASDLNSF